MATLSMSPLRSQLGAPAPYISSPLAGPHHNSIPPTSRPLPRRGPHFAPSRPIRPFASMSQTSTLSSMKPVKLIEPPPNFKTTFILDLTQGEFSRQD